MDFRMYDNALGRFYGMDALSEKNHYLSPFQFGNGNPVFWADPTGLDSGMPEWLQNLFNSVDWGYNATFTNTGNGNFEVTDFWGSGQPANLSISSGGGGGGSSSGGGGIAGFGIGSVYNVNGNTWNHTFSIGMPGNFVSGTGNRLNEVILTATKGKTSSFNNSAFAFAAISSGVLLADDVTGIGVADDVLIPFIYAGATCAWLYDNAELLAKQAREIDRILQKTLKPSGFTYELRVLNSGTYTDVRGFPVTLNAGDVWKYGETTSNSRYSDNKLMNMVPGGVEMIPIFFGNQVEIKVQEKIMIYGYTIMNGSLPPGNRIFR